MEDRRIIITDIKTGLATISGYHPDSYSTQVLISGVNKDVDKLIVDYKSIVETMQNTVDYQKETMKVYYDKLQTLRNKIEELTKKLIKSNKDYCPERIGYEVGYKYIHEHCDGLNCDQCTADQIAKGIE
jgi:hypothetical protein